MSGIGGVQTTDGSPPSAVLLSALGRALLHRGPDGESRYTSGGTGLLHTGAQPCGTERASPRLTVIDGGPAPGLQLPRMRLTAAAGTAGLALAACETAEDRIILGRDTFGLRPLYYAETERGLVFASEPRAIIASGVLTPRLNTEAVLELVQIQFTTGRRTLFDKIHRVLPGETLVAERGRIVERFRDGSLPERIDRGLSESGALRQLEALLSAAVADNLHGGPAGLIFDGRIESLALAAALKGLGRTDIPFFVVATGGPSARALAETCGGNAVLLDLGAETFFASLPGVVAALDDPGSDYASVALFHLAGAVSRHMRILLSSAGGDVLFGGLGRYRSALRPLWLGGRAMRARGFLEGLGILRDELPSWRDGLRATENRLTGQGLTRLQGVQALDCMHWLPNDVLPVLDRCVTAHGLEPRAPYLDPALAAFAFTLPDGLKIAPGRGSVLLRRWLAQMLPQSEPFTRHRGSTMPVTAWIAGEAHRLAPLIGANEGIRMLCAPDAVRRLFERLSQRPAKRLGQAAWQLLFFALWHSIHIEGRAPEGTVFDVLSG